MKFVLIVVWFGFPQQQQYPTSSIAWRQPLGVAMQEFDDKDACEAQAKYFASPYIDAPLAEELGSSASANIAPLRGAGEPRHGAHRPIHPNPDQMPTVRRRLRATRAPTAAWTIEP